MNFKQALTLITREKRQPRALHWMERFIEAIPTKAADDKKFLKKWFTKKDDLDRSAAFFYQGIFARWKREEKSRSARLSSLRRKPRLRLKKESEDIIDDVIRGGEH
jgi:hypothetical protein